MNPIEEALLNRCGREGVNEAEKAENEVATVPKCPTDGGITGHNDPKLLSAELSLRCLSKHACSRITRSPA